MSLFQFFIKRSFDLLASGLGIILLFPIFLLLCIVVKLSSPGPVFFVQKRVGRNGRLFNAVKFRTMRGGAEKEGTVTTANDSRVTAAGRWLRACKLDELPQLWNVLTGAMSFVGPRPDVPGYADRLSGGERAILALRPGITGPATLYFRDEEALLARAADPKQYNDTVLWPAKVKMNLAYLEQWGFWKDVGYILITLFPSLDRAIKLVPGRPKIPEDI